MKTNEEYRSSINRKAEALFLQRKRRHRLFGVLIPTAGCAAIACAAVLLTGPAATASLPPAGLSSAVSTDAAPTEPAAPTTGDDAPLPAVSFAEIESNAGAARLYFDPETTYEETWTKEQEIAYIGRDITPRYIAPGLEEPDGTGGRTVVRNNDGSLAFDRCGVIYWNPAEGYDPLQKRFSVSVSRIGCEREYWFDWPEGNSEIRIGDTAVRFGHMKMGYGGTYENPEGYQDWYVAEFTLNGVGYQVLSENLNETEFLSMTLSLFDEEDARAVATGPAELDGAACA